MKSTCQNFWRAAQFNASALPNILHQKIQVITFLYIYASSFIEDKERELNKQVQKSIPLSVKEYDHKNLENVQKA